MLWRKVHRFEESSRFAPFVNYLAKLDLFANFLGQLLAEFRQYQRCICTITFHFIPNMLTKRPWKIADKRLYIQVLSAL